MRDTLKKLQDLGLVSESEGAHVIGLEEFKLGRPVIQKQSQYNGCSIIIHGVELKLFQDGTSLYFTRDIAGATEQHEKYKFDKIIYGIASEQDFYCAQFLKTIELMGYPWADTLEHVSSGTYII